MCGICGFTGPGPEGLLRRMATCLRHRGPDEEGCYSDPGASLGLRRLSIIDPATGQQPMASEDRRKWSVCNGEIYNFSQLRRELEERGHHFSTDHSDTEVIVHLYEERGADFAHALNGMFAIALWDRDRGEMLLVRDRLGVKPLFYAVVDGELVFASEIKAILVHPKVRKEPRGEALYHYFSLKHVPAPLTAFAGIDALGPGERLFFRKGQLRRERWWKLDFKAREGRAGRMKEEEAESRILSLLEDATRLRMVSDVPVGAYLSGGVDSSTVVALMSRRSPRPVKTFCLGYTEELGQKTSDLLHAREVAKHFGTEHHEYILSHREVREGVGEVLRAFDQPFSGTISTFFLTRLIKQHVKVALSGDGADELFGSYLSHRTALPLHYFTRDYPRSAEEPWSEEDRRRYAPCDREYLADLYRKSGGREADWRGQLLVLGDADKEGLLTEEFAALGKGAGTRELLAAYFREVTASDPLNRVLEMEWNSLFPDQVLAFVDFLSMAHSVEVRSPFLDYRLAELVAPLPGDWKIRGGEVKALLKRTVEPLLPPGITRRPKEGFVLPVFDWLAGPLRDYPREVLSPERLRRHGFFRPEVVAGWLARHEAGERGLAARIWNLMMFQAWWESYF